MKKEDIVSPLQRIVFISIPEETAEELKGFPLDTAKLLPVEIPPGEENWTVKDLSWEMIISAMFKIFAWDPDHEDCGYYRMLIHALEPGIEFTMTKTGIEKANSKDFSVAEEIFRALVHYNSGNVNNYINLALVLEEQSGLYENLGNFELSEKYLSEAFKTYHNALELHGTSPDLLFNLGNFYIKRKNPEKARNILQNFILYEPPGKRKDFVLEILQKFPKSTHEEVLLLEAYDFIQMEQEDQGIERIKLFLENHDDVWNAWFLLGWAYRRKEDYQAGKEAFLKSIEYEGNHTDSYNELAICLMELGEYSLCRQYLKKALILEGENTKTIMNFGILALKEHDLSEAERFFRTVLVYDPRNTTAQKYIQLLSEKK